MFCSYFFQIMAKQEQFSKLFLKTSIHGATIPH